MSSDHLKFQRTADNAAITCDAFSFEIQMQDLSLFYNIHHGDLRLDHATSAILLLLQKDEVLPLVPCLLSEGDFNLQAQKFNDAIGEGLRLDLPCVFRASTNTAFQLAATWIAKVYAESAPGLGPFITIQIILKDWYEEAADWQLFGFAPLFMKAEEKNQDRNPCILNLRTASELTTPGDITFYSNGYQSWSVNKLMKAEDRWKSAPIEAIRINMENQDQRLTGAYQSEFHSVISDRISAAALVLGFITLKDQFSRIIMDPLPTPGKIRWLTAYSQTDGIAIKDLNVGLKRSEELMVILSPPGFAYPALKEICRIGGIKAKAKIAEQSLVGWCSWYYYYTKISQNEMISNLEFFKRRPDMPIGLVQLDDGYQTEISDWGIDPPYVFNEKFPRGLKWLVDQIHEGKYNAGLWVAPFFTNKDAKLCQSHPNWVLRDAKSKPVKTTYNWGNWQYSLDLSIDEVTAHVERLANTVSRSWGFDFLKIDFIFSGEAYNGCYQNLKYSRAQILRRGVEAVRKGMGDEKVILGCGAPLGPCVGLVDVMRIGPDTAAVWSPMDVIANFAKVYIPSLRACLKSTIQRSYMHKTYWINDPDCVVVRRNKSKLSLEEVLLQLTVFGLSGGQVLISDDMPLVDTDRIEILKRLLPPHPESAVPMDLFITDFPEIYAKTVKTQFGIRHLVALINWTDHPKQKTVQLCDIVPDFQRNQTTQQYLVIDYWNEKAIAIISATQPLTIPEIPRHGCVYLGVIPLEKEMKAPILAFSTLHICQGVLEVTKFVVSPAEMHITLDLAGKREGKLFCYYPACISAECEGKSVEKQENDGIPLYVIPLSMEDHKDLVVSFKNM
jgi:alpha-galactosidase